MAKYKVTLNTAGGSAVEHEAEHVAVSAGWVVLTDSVGPVVRVVAMYPADDVDAVVRIRE